MGGSTKATYQDSNPYHSTWHHCHDNLSSLTGFCGGGGWLIISKVFIHYIIYKSSHCLFKMIIWKAITCAHLAASADITFYRSNQHVSGLLNPFEWSKHQNRGPTWLLALWYGSMSLDMSGAVSFIHYYDPGQQQWETSFQHHYTHWWKCNISSRHLPSLPVCHLHPWSISRRWRENAHLSYSSTWVLSGRKNRELSVWHVFFPFFLWSVHFQVQ